MNKILSFKPVTPGLRHLRLLDRSFLLKGKPLKTHTLGFSSPKGRNHQGGITIFHRGGGHKRSFRLIQDINSPSYQGVLLGLEHNPMGGGLVGRIFDPDNKIQSYVFTAEGNQRGEILKKGYGIDPTLGNRLTLGELPTGSLISNLHYHRRTYFLRAAGSYGILIERNEKGARVKLKSGEHRIFPLNCYATLGSVSKEGSDLTVLGKAGRKRWLGFRPHVRGVAMNPIDHPHGGGEGKTSGGRPSVTPWGRPTKGEKTSRSSHSYRVEARPRLKGKGEKREKIR